MYKNIFLMRHGEAGTLPGQSDFDRELTQNGIREVQTAFRAFQKTHDLPDVFLVSPVWRAQMTWQVIRDLLPNELPKYDCQSLVYSSFPSALFEEIKVWDHQTLFLISHQPLIGDFIYKYGHVQTRGIPVHTASIHALKFEPDQNGQLKGKFLGLVE